MAGRVRVQARCPWCRRDGRTLTGAGLLPRHLRYTRAFSGELPPVCVGTGRAPREFYEQARVGARAAAQRNGAEHE